MIGEERSVKMFLLMGVVGVVGEEDDPSLAAGDDGLLRLISSSSMRWTRLSEVKISSSV